MDYFEKQCLNGWDSFKMTLLYEWLNYRQYDEKDRILEEQLKEYRKIFETAKNRKEFFAELRIIWEKKYHFVINSYKELIQLFSNKRMFRRKIEINLLPESDKYHLNELKGNDQTIAITETFYYKLKRQMKRNPLYIKNSEGRIFQMSFKEKDERRFQELHIKEIDIIEKDLSMTRIVAIE